MLHSLKVILESNGNSSVSFQPSQWILNILLQWTTDGSSSSTHNIKPVMTTFCILQQEESTILSKYLATPQKIGFVSIFPCFLYRRTHAKMNNFERLRQSTCVVLLVSLNHLLLLNIITTKLLEVYSCSIKQDNANSLFK